MNKDAAVEAFEEADRALEDFKAKHRVIFAVFMSLAETRNTLLQEAEKIVRTTGTTQGPFIKTGTRKKIDATKICSLLGEEKFIRNGGVVTHTRQCNVTLENLEKMVASGEISRKDYDDAIQISNVYSIPSKVQL